MSPHRRALITIIIALSLDIILGIVYGYMEHMTIAHGLYCALGNAVTEGVCTAPSSTGGYITNVLEFLLVVPLFAATFSLFTTGLTSVHIRKHVKESEERIKSHVSETQKKYN